MAQPGRALVVGGSLGGLLIGNLLLRDGWDVHLHERADEALDARGAGIVAHARLFEAVADILPPQQFDRIGLRIEQRITLNRDGSVLARHAQGQTLASWSHLYRTLRAAFPHNRYHPGRAATHVTQQNSQATVQYADGGHDTADLVIAADGVHSTLRNTLEPATQPAFAGYVAWRGLVDEVRISPDWRDLLMTHFSFALPPGEQILGYPVSGANNDFSVGRRYYNFVWYRPASADALLALLTDASGKHWPRGIPPPLIRSKVLDETRRAAADTLPPAFAEVVHRTDSLFFQPIVDLTATHLVHGRVALLGDAAFVARPHCGMGVTKAADDALALRDALRSAAGLDAALQAYAHRQQAAGHAVVERARALGAYMQAQRTSGIEQAHAEAFRSPQAIMQHTAVPPPWR